MTTSPESVAVEVTDDGDGIPEDRTSDLFDRPDSVGVDHGLGLYLIGRLPAQYGGSVELVETGSDGSVFRVVLPRCSEPSDDRSIEERVDSPNPEALANGANRDSKDERGESSGGSAPVALPRTSRRRHSPHQCRGRTSNRFS